ncbi:tripartite tricarboxylate transporter TctB family protein [Rubrimonas cliftonensis]|uniref:Putative tricarboxylic transport membrane protein n=1 Tax=Rubrimonas cliftonensis TaxID=89524 RepID=A0A1H4ECG3_9RHOB|nr:tripartite tricarboxylate transporter TctB family protein [Rubrimonas cliftonensis]SEA82754.1 putative tricarboxylic transport membrane protein [Rubrimonas cliftonensis]
MALDRCIALVFIAICLVYGWTAWFGMDGSLPPFMRRNPVWPSSFPKVLSIVGLLIGLAVVLTQPPPAPPKEGDIDYRRLTDYKLGQALLLMGLMVAYALLLRPLGFIGSTAGFLIAGAMTLGERKLHILIPVALAASLSVWWLVQEVLGIFLRPLPSFL